MKKLFEFFRKLLLALQHLFIKPVAEIKKHYKQTQKEKIEALKLELKERLQYHKALKNERKKHVTTKGFNNYALR